MNFFFFFISNIIWISLFQLDNAYACDPRILKFREEEKERRNAAKRARQEAVRQRIEEEERVKFCEYSNLLRVLINFKYCYFLFLLETKFYETILSKRLKPGEEKMFVSLNQLIIFEGEED